MSNWVWAGTRNGSHHVGRLYEQAQLDAAGFDRSADKGQPRFNGGVTAHREIRLQCGDKIYRFAGSGAKKLEDRIRGRWWFDYDTCLFLWSKSGGTDEGFRNAARAAFAVLPEWSDMDVCATGVLKHDVWAIAGNTAAATGRSGSAHNPHGISVQQIFIPGGLTRDDFEEVWPGALTRKVY